MIWIRQTQQSWLRKVSLSFEAGSIIRGKNNRSSLPYHTYSSSVQYSTNNNLIYLLFLDRENHILKYEST